MIGFLYFFDLYQDDSERNEKVNLHSDEFWHDVILFFCKHEHARKKLLSGIRILALSEDLAGLRDIELTLERNRSLMGLKTVTYPSHIKNEFWEKLDEVLEEAGNIALKSLKRSEGTQFKTKRVMGFVCKLSTQTLNDIFDFMSANNYLETSLNNFNRVFNSYSIEIEEPITWLIQNERGTNSGRGNQTALFSFLNIIIGGLTNEDLRKAADIFADKKGAFISKKLDRPKKGGIKYYGFEEELKNIIDKQTR